MDGKKLAGIVLLLIGLGMAGGSLFSDYIVAGGRPGIGLFQVVGAVIGAAIALAGAILLIRK